MWVKLKVCILSCLLVGWSHGSWGRSWVCGFTECFPSSSTSIFWTRRSVKWFQSYQGTLWACSYGPGRWDGPLGRDPAERLLSIQKHCSVHMRRRAVPLGGIPVQGYRGPSYRARQIGAAPAHLPGWKIANGACWNEFADQNKWFTRSNIRAPVITWQNTSQRPGQNFRMWMREKIRPTWWAVLPTGLSHIHMNRALIWAWLLCLSDCLGNKV